jgi:hypothetical protein
MKAFDLTADAAVLEVRSTRMSIMSPPKEFAKSFRRWPV